MNSAERPPGAPECTSTLLNILKAPFVYAWRGAMWVLLGGARESAKPLAGSPVILTPEQNPNHHPDVRFVNALIDVLVQEELPETTTPAELSLHLHGLDDEHAQHLTRVIYQHRINMHDFCSRLESLETDFGLLPSIGEYMDAIARRIRERRRPTVTPHSPPSQVQ